MIVLARSAFSKSSIGSCERLSTQALAYVVLMLVLKPNGNFTCTRSHGNVCVLYRCTLSNLFLNIRLHREN